MKYVAIIILAFAFYVTNPNEDDFNIFIKENVREYIKEDNGLVKLFLEEFFSELAKKGTYRKDYVFFSKFVVDTSIISTFKEDIPQKIEFIGFFGEFYPLIHQK